MLVESCFLYLCIDYTGQNMNNWIRGDYAFFLRHTQLLKIHIFFCFVFGCPLLDWCLPLSGPRSWAMMEVFVVWFEKSCIEQIKFCLLIHLNLCRIRHHKSIHQTIKAKSTYDILRILSWFKIPWKSKEDTKKACMIYSFNHRKNWYALCWETYHNSLSDPSS